MCEAQYGAASVVAETRPVVVIDKWPIPAIGGSRLRLWHLLRSVALVGPADLLVLAPDDDSSRRLLLEALPGWSVLAVEVPRQRRSLRVVLRWMVLRDVPAALLMRDIAPAVEAVRELGNGIPKLIVAMRSVPAKVACSASRRQDAVVVDFEDVQSIKLERLNVAQADGAQPRRHRLMALFRQRIDQSAWRRFEAAVVERADLATVCSTHDRAALGTGTVVPNGAIIPTSVARQPTRLPTLLYVGALGYPPNILAAQRLAGEIFPLVRQDFPEACVELVGAACPDVEALDAVDGVSVRGFVADLSEVLARADVLVVPLTVGSGTRLKILEAFAHRIPVVSTTIGAEGLEVNHGEHLLIADTNADLAAAVANVMRDPSATAQRVGAAAALVARSYGWSRIEADFADRLRALIASAQLLSSVPDSTARR